MFKGLLFLAEVICSADKTNPRCKWREEEEEEEEDKVVKCAISH